MACQSCRDRAKLIEEAWALAKAGDLAGVKEKLAKVNGSMKLSIIRMATRVYHEKRRTWMGD